MKSSSMLHTKTFMQNKTGLGHQRRPSRRALQAHCLHKALRPPSKGPITAPADVVYECLTLLRRPDLESLAPFFPAASSDPCFRSVHLEVGGQIVEEAGPLACCHTFMDTAARRVLPGHLLRRCRVLSSVQLGDVCQMRVALTARTGEEAVFVWRLRRAPEAAAGAAPAGADADTDLARQRRESHVQQMSPQHDSQRQKTASASSALFHQDIVTEHPTDSMTDSQRRWEGPGASSSNVPSSSTSTSTIATCISSSADACRGHGESEGEGADARGGKRLEREASSAITSGLGSANSGGGASGSESGSDDNRLAVVRQQPSVTAWLVESIRRDDSHDEEEMPTPSPMGRGPHPRCSPEQVVKAQLAALRMGDVAGAASFNVWNRSTSGGWDIHLNAFKAMLRQPSYHVLLTSDAAELGPSALPSGRRMLQQVHLLASKGTSVAAAAAAAALYGARGDFSGAGNSVGRSLVYQLCMQANGCWSVEGIQPVQ